MRNQDFTSAIVTLPRTLAAPRLRIKSVGWDVENSAKKQKLLNKELTARNSQLLELLRRQRSTADELQNILYSTKVATLFLDKSLNVKFHTPATELIFTGISGDVGRPFTGLISLSADTAFVVDARAVLLSLVPLEREIEIGTGNWFLRRILPYRTHNDTVEGVVVTFTPINERKRIRLSANNPATWHIAGLTARQRQIMTMVLDGQPSKNIAADLNISRRTVENHRASIMKRTGAKSLPALARLALAATPNTAPTPL